MQRKKAKIIPYSIHSRPLVGIVIDENTTIERIQIRTKAKMLYNALRIKAANVNCQQTNVPKQSGDTSPTNELEESSLFKEKFLTVVISGDTDDETGHWFSAINGRIAMQKYILACNSLNVPAKRKVIQFCLAPVAVTLDLSHVPFHPDTERKLHLLLKDHPYLKKYNFSNRELTGEQVEAIAGLLVPREIDEIDLSNNRITSDSFIAVRALVNKLNTRKLILDGNALQDERNSGIFLNHLTTFTQIQHLSLNNCGFGDSCIASFCKESGKTQIQSTFTKCIELRQNKISAQGAEPLTFCFSKNFPNLEMLSLGENDIPDNISESVHHKFLAFQDRLKINTDLINPLDSNLVALYSTSPCSTESVMELPINRNDRMIAFELEGIKSITENRAGKDKQIDQVENKKKSTQVYCEIRGANLLIFPNPVRNKNFFAEKKFFNLNPVEHESQMLPLSHLIEITDFKTCGDSFEKLWLQIQGELSVLSELWQKVSKRQCNSAFYHNWHAKDPPVIFTKYDHTWTRRR
ncbi:hypothetical protein IE077_003051 [Cardiosporidium cionae]|uniref:Uncharacterized protein n=1 Tax=Cardiosporidium cionae TaxID=476202 RepID=A0ABQ7JGG7_9APIC|nr:hypothetical protein IE077_003051 [Cardiosporidium cionae]|eukprot:KAF8823130.1 hypothetical protein IE077_003051 [Cardiosporidium cionae]